MNRLKGQLGGRLASLTVRWIIILNLFFLAFVSQLASWFWRPPSIAELLYSLFLTVAAIIMVRYPRVGSWLLALLLALETPITNYWDSSPYNLILLAADAICFDGIFRGQYLPLIITLAARFYDDYSTADFSASLVGFGWNLFVIMAGFSARLVKKRLDLAQENILSAKLETKRQIAHNIHDSTARELSRIILTCRLIKTECLEEETPLTLEHLDLIESEATSTLANTRELISFLEDELDPAHKEIGLEELLSEQTKIWGKKQKLTLSSVNTADLSLFSPSSKKLITDLILEILANAEKYAKPNSTVKLEITNQENRLQINSLNLLGKQQITEAVLSGKTGLKNLKDRFSKLNGDLEYGSTKDSWQLQACLRYPNSLRRK